MLNSLAQELNTVLNETIAMDLFSDLGKRMYFPNGIIAQSNEAKEFGKTANGTIGTMLVDGKPAMLEAIHKFVPNFTSAELVGYAPTAGNPVLRTAWKENILKKNPLLNEKSFSMPVLVPGLTAGLSYVADLFLDSERPLLSANPCWDNYELICTARRNAPFHQFNMFSENRLDIQALERAIKKEAETGSVRLILNFPQNPSGYSPTKEETEKIISILKECADDGTKILLISDDAYFGLNYEDNIEEHSLFAHTCNLHKNILAVKVDGPTKEDFVWGFRAGFVTFGALGLTQEHYNALVTKLMGVIRSSVSCSSTPPQTMIIKSIDDPNIEGQKDALTNILLARYKKVRAFVDSHKSSVLFPLPFNSGYFMSFDVRGKDAEALRKKLLYEYGIGTVAINSGTLRVAFSSLEESQIEMVYSTIYKAAEEL